MSRTAFAERIAAGLGGWFQQLAAQNLEHQVGEDAARVELVRMISAQRSYIPETAQRPTNWPADTKKRIDVAVLGKRAGAQGWYGAIELKWPGYSFDAIRRGQGLPFAIPSWRVWKSAALGDRKKRMQPSESTEPEAFSETLDFRPGSNKQQHISVR